MYSGNNTVIICDSLTDNYISAQTHTTQKYPSQADVLCTAMLPVSGRPLQYTAGTMSWYFTGANVRLLRHSLCSSDVNKDLCHKDMDL